MRPRSCTAHGAPSALAIRAARAGEAGVLLAIQREAAVAAFAHIFPPDRYPFPDGPIREGWQAAIDAPDIEVYVAEEHGEPVGAVSVGEGYLRTLYVRPARWGAGVGSALHDHALERMRQLGLAEARLWTLAENRQGRAFYERRAWRSTGRTRVVPFPPNPLDVEYARPLAETR